MQPTHPTRFDVMLGISYPTRVFQRVTREQADASADAIGYRINWASARMIGNATAEVSMVRAAIARATS